MLLLNQHGHKITTFARKHTEDICAESENYFPADIKTDSINISWDALKTLKEIFYSRETKNALRKLLKEFRPHLAHAHNIYGRLTPSVLDLMAQKNIPIIMTLHDYKLICPNYKMLNDRNVCEDCEGRNFYMATKNRCHKNSFFASLVYMMESYYSLLFRKYKKNVSIFITPSLFMKNKFIEFGWPKDQITYLPNFVTVSEIDPRFDPGKYFLFLGRLSSEKGVHTLLESFMMLEFSDARLIVAGKGPDRRKLEQKSREDPRIHFTGYLSGDVLRKTIRNALAVIVPSEWYENAPISILESFAYGKPVIGSRIGGIPEMIDDRINGFLFTPRNAVDLKKKLERTLSISDKEIREMGKNARLKVERQFNAELHYGRLMDVYHTALSKL
jgi:glycosyltransferase involved in cell wall biosynthesis